MDDGAVLITIHVGKISLVEAITGLSWEIWGIKDVKIFKVLYFQHDDGVFFVYKFSFIIRNDNLLAYIPRMPLYGLKRDKILSTSLFLSTIFNNNK